MKHRCLQAGDTLRNDLAKMYFLSAKFLCTYMATVQQPTIFRYA
ncbi:MAG: hypothetical protein RML35_05715 [Chloroherpetonaceae bacterium]|nr:hypothetical protein [Chloroherpetonaceae bacterium]MDW8465689.1 hypothetical protein [Chloroherpetonaceae bacterium]